MEALPSGTYTVKTEKEVTFWPAPDKDGDGAEVWITVDLPNGHTDRRRARDSEGNEIFHYDPPEGFANVPSFDHTDHYVKVDERGRVLRDAKGNAIEIREGCALVENPDGSTELLEDEYAQYMFAKAHEDTTPSTPPAKKAAAPAKKES